METNYLRLYNKLDTLTGGIKGFLQGRGYLRLKSSGYMDLIVEKIGKDTISIAHYYEQNGDLVQDPEITIRIYPETQLAEALTFQNCYLYQEVYPESEKVNIKLKKELNDFLDQWLTNLRNQGFYN